jgi:hypothetical protein
MKDINIFKEEYGSYLKERMVEQGVTTSVLAKKIGYSYEGTRLILKEKGSYWGVFKVCRALDVEIKDLINSKT